MKFILSLFFVFVFLPAIEAQTYFLNGDAQAVGGDCYLLTGEFGTQNGTVWYADQIDLDEPFDFSFTMNYGTIDGNGADGICFVLQTVGTAAIGESGGGLGYLNFGTSLGIEFDTWQNGEYGDPFEDHIAIEKNGDINHNSANNIAGPVQADAFDQNIEDGEDHIVRITWDPLTTALQVYFDCVFRLEGDVDLVNEIFGGSSEVYWGFTAATGGAFNNQTVCLQENIVTSASEVFICNGASTTLSAGSSLDGIYDWSPGLFLSDSTSSVVIANPPTTTPYTVSFIDLCGDLNELEVTVTVEPLQIDLSGFAVITCLNPDVNLTADINFSENAIYEWDFNGVILLQGENENELLFTESGIGVLTANVQNACFDTLTFEIESNFETFTANAGPDLVLNCYSEEQTFFGISNSDEAAVQWLFNGNPISGAASAEYTTDQDGTYTFVVVNPANGCAAQDVALLTEDFSTPELFIPDQDTLSCLKPQVVIGNVQVTSNHDYSVEWSTVEGNIVSGQSSLNPLVDTEALYQITATDVESGCSVSETIFIEEDEELNIDASLIQFPNVFTPNGDSNNNSWHPFLITDAERDISFFFSSFNLKVYNRWGTVVFETDDASKQWTNSGLSEGVYFYHVQYKTLCSDGSLQMREGHIQLMR